MSLHNRAAMQVRLKQKKNNNNNNSGIKEIQNSVAF
jgi:hypothetical protein